VSPRYPPAMELTFRPADRADLPAVLGLWRVADAEPTSTDDVESLERLVAHDPDALVLAFADQRLAGSVVAAWDGWRGTIYRLAVAPDFRRRGLASQLVEQAERRLGDLGAVRLQATVVGTNPRATGFWRAGSWSENVGQLRFTKTRRPSRAR
jgi:ribosomal protein S18 acetylase RimI-like enzyme